MSERAKQWIKKEKRERTGELLLDYLYLDDIPAEIAEMTWLVVLDLRANRINDIRFLEKLTSLTFLNLSCNYINDYSFLEKLTSLTSLDLSSNQISDIRFLEKLTSLTSLNLGNNQISDIRFLEKLTSLTSLNLSFNQINDISPLLGLIQKGIPVTIREHNVGINLNSNPIATPPFEVVDQGNEAILRYFAELKKGKITNNEIKLILVGNSTAGKTSLSRFLRERKFDKSQQSTHGGDLMQVWRPEGHDLKVNIWDFGGQEYYLPPTACS